MREKLWDAVQQIAEVDVVVDIEVLPNESVSWFVYHHPWFGKFVGLLREAQATQTYLQFPSKTIDFESLTRFEQLGGRRCATKVQTETNSKDFFAFKGADLRTFLTYYDEVESGSSDTDEDDLTLLKTGTMPMGSSRTSPHTPISSPRLPHLSRYRNPPPPGMRVKTRTRRPSFAVLLHKRGPHDIKPGDSLIDDNEHLLLIDWEQSDAPCTTLALEADGTWDVTEQKGADDVPHLVYTKYE
ncbi:hypothetical protein BDW59DRAFT_165511 [Aspergillus cavernicola]|uniref:Uncharacterized protein n=1 Tax=Aspergillus cavernicola TaxID=176166 RepID=A0ABR4HSG6_9EURO